MFFACTLLHRELRDYSLGQVAIAVFQALLAITQLLCHVSALLTSACNVNKHNYVSACSACNVFVRLLKDYYEC